MSGLGRTILQLVVIALLSCGGYLVGSWLDTRAYRSYAAHEGVDCARLDWAACQVALEPVYLEGLRHNATSTNFNWRLKLGGIMVFVGLGGMLARKT